MQSFARKLNLIALALGAALTAPGCATDWFSSSSSDFVAGELSQDVENLPDPNAPPTPAKRSAIVSPLGASFKESPDRLLLQANAYFDQGKFHDSARLYQKYLATPEAATAPPTVLGQAHYRIAVVARKKMSFAEAKREFEIALRYEPQNQQYRFELGKSAFDGADYATADAAFSALIAQNPNYPQAQYYYGLTLLEGTRRAEAIAPLTQAVGELEAASLLTDKYYAIGETENAATWEAQTTQIAARLGRPVPTFPNKPAFASTVQPHAPLQVAQAEQPQAPVQDVPTVQPQAPVQAVPTVQPQAPVQDVPTVQPQAPVQDVPTVQPQAPVQAVPTVQPQAPVQAVPTVQPQAPVQVAPTEQPQAPVQVVPTEQPQAPAQVVPTVQPQAPAPFVAAVAPSISEPVAPQPFAVATTETPASQEVAQQPTADALPSSTEEPAASAPILAAQDAKNEQNSTACIGRRNPGLFATSTGAFATSAAETGFRPGSISTTAPSAAQTPAIAAYAPTAPTSQTAQNLSFVGPRLPQAPRFDAEAAFRRLELLVELENCVAERFAPLAPIYETAPSPFQVADAQELYAAAPSPTDLADADDEEFDEDDDFAFASSGSPQTASAPSPAATIGGFGSYQAPTFDATPVAPVPQVAQAAPATQIPFAAQNAYSAPVPQVAQAASATQIPFAAQNAYPALIPQVAQAAPTTQVSGAPQNAYPAPIPQIAQAAPTTQVPGALQNAYPAPVPQVAQAAPASSQYAAPNAARRPSTPEERLQAAIAAGAEVREISPEEYRRAVQVGMSGQAQPR